MMLHTLIATLFTGAFLAPTPAVSADALATTESPVVAWTAPNSYLSGKPYRVMIDVTVPDGGSTVPGWLFTPAAFSVDGKAIAQREDLGTVQLPAGAELHVPLDLGPHLKVEGNFSLAFATGLATGDPIEVRLLRPAPEGLDFMQMPAEELGNYHMLLQTNRGDLEVEMWPETAPNHVRNYLDLAYTGFYDGSIFHRVIPGFMIQGGDPTGTGNGNGPRVLKAEFSKIKHERGVLSAARTNDPNSASCQFFVCHASAPHLDGQYSAFGKLVNGFETLDAIATTPRGAGDRPNEPQRILSASVVLATKADKKR
jgi:peptidyl-prolyl cis-trans isomerase B (cyclophilin B)